MNRLLTAIGLGLILVSVPSQARADFSWEVEITVHYSEAPQFGHWDRIWLYECQVWDQTVKQWKSLGPPTAMWDAGHWYTWKTTMPVGKADGKYFVQIVKTKGGKDRTEIPWDQINWRVLRDQEVPYRVPGGWSGSIHYLKLETTR